MGFFDDLDDEVIVESASTELDEDLKRSDEGNIGDVCFYDLITNEFGTASTVDTTKTSVEYMDDWKYITMGIIVNQYEEDSTVDVLMCGFLMKEPLDIPVSYWSREKQPYIRAYAYDMFRRYVKAFFRQCPGYEELLKLEITMPTVSDMLKVQDNSPEIFTTLRILSKDITRFEEYYDRMFRNYIYVRHTNGRIYQMKLSRNKDVAPDVIIPTAMVDGDFMCMFRHVDAYNKKKKQIKGDEREFFSE